MIFPPISNNSNPIKKMSRIFKASVLLLFLSAHLHASQEAILRLDPGGHTGVVRKLVITPDGRLVTASDELGAQKRKGLSQEELDRLASHNL